MKYQKPINTVNSNDEFSSSLMEAYGKWMGGDCFQNTDPVDVFEAFNGMDPQSHGAEIEDTTKKKKVPAKPSSAAQLETRKEELMPEELVGTTYEVEMEDGEIIIIEKVKMDGKDDNGFKSCWKGYKKAGTKVKGGKEVNNCVKAGVEYEGDELTEKLDPVGKEDKDIDNDGDHDKSDKYLHARRKKIGKILAMKGKK